jgi:ubiquinone/menaquinone biosynthesis C-methylase UbiE
MGSAKVQGEVWSLAAQDWANLQEPTAKPLWQAMLDAAKVGHGTRFFDAGCGSGGASIIAAKRGAIISGLDASDALIVIARERLPQGDFRVGDLESLPFSVGVFDAVIASISVQYCADPVAALRELRRVCASNGYIVVSTWGPPENCEQRVVFKAVRDVQPSPPSGDGPFALSASGALEGLIEQADLKVLGRGEVDCPFEYRDLETHWRAQRSAGPFQAAISAVGEERLRAAVEQAAEPYRISTGGVRLVNRFLYVTATV